MNKYSQLNAKQPGVTTMVMIPQEEWLNLHEKLDNIAELVTNRNASDKDSEWIESKTARKMLGVSPKTWQNYRDRRDIRFAQIGRKIYVKREDLDKFMESHCINEHK